MNYERQGPRGRVGRAEEAETILPPESGPKHSPEKDQPEAAPEEGGKAGHPSPGRRRRYREEAKTILPPQVGLVLEPGVLLDERFELVKQLGRGGMGEVWLAKDMRLEVQRALKFVPKELSSDRRALRSLESEAKLVARLKHPNIVSMYSLERIADGAAFMVFEYIEGFLLEPEGERAGSLDDWLYETGEVSEEDVRKLLPGILSALDYAHSFRDELVTGGIVHRDIKPANILLNAKGEPLLADFGIARTVRSSMSRLTGAAGTSGTLPYMSPEQVRGRKVDGRSDLYSLGITIYEMLTGDPPFIEGDIALQHDQEPVPRIDDVSDEMNDWLQRCVAKKPQGRWESAGVALAALDGREKVAPAAETRERERRDRERRDAAERVWLAGEERQRRASGLEAGTRKVIKILPDVEMAFRWCPPGEFLMGSPASEAGRDSDEGPQTRVTLTRGFWMGETPVTQAQWEAIMGSNPSYFRGRAGRLLGNLLGPTNSGNPVEQVSWNDIMGAQDAAEPTPRAGSFMARLTENQRGSSELSFTLPTEAQWEYACRAGSTSRYYFGDNESELGNHAWCHANSGGSTQPVRQKRSNAWGLYDMHGNVWDWTSSWHGTYPGGSATDFTGPTTGAFRVYRGGSWYYDPVRVRPALRYRGTPDYRHIDLGFRVVAVPAE